MNIKYFYYSIVYFKYTGRVYILSPHIIVASKLIAVIIYASLKYTHDYMLALLTAFIYLSTIIMLCCSEIDIKSAYILMELILSLK